MKRLKCVLMSFLIMCISLCAFLVSGCGTNKAQPQTLSLDYMKNLMVDANGVTAYSIRRETKTNGITPVSLHADSENKASAISLLSATLMEDIKGVRSTASKTVVRNYLYSTSESYEFGNVEYDENNIKKVSFMKNKEVSEDVYDDNGILIDSNRKIEQEEFDAQINRFYATKQFTYIQFVPLVESSGYYNYKTDTGETGTEYVKIRLDSMVYDEDGASDFDSGNGNVIYDSEGGLSIWKPSEPAYYSSPLSSSFVIDNFTGYIYKIEGIAICGFLNGLVVDNNAYVYSVSTDSQHNLVFTDILPNKDVKIINAVLDNYGWVFVANDVINYVDVGRKIIYITQGKYAFDADRNVYKLDYDTGSIGHLTHKIVNGTEVLLENTGVIRDIASLFQYEINGEAYGQVLSFVGMYRDLDVYKFTIVSSSGISVAYNHATYGGLFVEYDYSYHWLDTNYDTIIAKNDDALYYKSINLADYRDGETILKVENDFIQLSDLSLAEAKDYYMSVGNDQYKIKDVYYHAGANKTSYYHIVRTTTGVELVELTSKSYTDNVFIFQPINK